MSLTCAFAARAAVFQIACDKMKVPPEEVLFLDNLSVNLKPTHVMGMTTIKVTSASQVLAVLAQLLP